MGTHALRHRRDALDEIRLKTDLFIGCDHVRDHGVTKDRSGAEAKLGIAMIILHI
jgi:hypothetical protein